MNRRRSSVAIEKALPLEDEDLLREILLRLPPQPSSLPRASAVCKRWRNILSDDVFLRRFRRHHRKPPFLGFFNGDVYTGYHFTSVMDLPDRIPAARFSLRVPMPKDIIPYNKRWNLMGCRHGLAVLVNLSQRQIVVLDPVSRQQYQVTCPPGLMLGQDYMVCCHAAVVCADNEDGHVHSDCFSRPLKLVFIWVTKNLQDTHRQAFACLSCLYESVSGLWGDISSMECTYEVYDIGPSVLVENALCWLLFGSDVLVFDLESQSLSVIKKPIDTDSYGSVQLLRTDDGGLGLAYLLELTIQLWERKSNCDGVVSWVLLQKTIQLEEFFPHGVFSDFKTVLLSGYDEDTNVIILSAVTGVFMLQLDSVQIKHINKRNSICYLTFHPYTNFYTTGNTSMPTWVMGQTVKSNLFVLQIACAT